MAHLTAEEKVVYICQKFINDNEISCEEAVYQRDHIIENAYGLIAFICDTLGYYEYPDETLIDRDL